MKVERDEETVKPTVTFGKGVDYRELFRVVGAKGLFIVIAFPAKTSRMVCMGALSVQKKVVVDKSKLVRLDQYHFWRQDGSSIKMAEVFDNLDQFSPEVVMTLDDQSLMDTMLPEYDPDKFKSHHARMVRDWFLEVKNKYKELEEADLKK